MMLNVAYGMHTVMQNNDNTTFLSCIITDI
jgi:hypothetical protein